MTESFPYNKLLAEPLYGFGQYVSECIRIEIGGTTSGLTRAIFRKSLSVYVLSTLTATSCPSYSHFHTSPNPPRYNARPVGPLDNSSCSDLGSKVWPAHVLYKDLRHFLRIPGARLGLSNTYQVEGRGQI